MKSPLTLTLAISLLAVQLSAQSPAAGSAIVPAAQRTAFGNSNNNIPMSWTPTRYQQVFLSSEMPTSQLIRFFGFRQDDAFNSRPGQTVELEATLGYTSYDHNSLTSSFDANFVSTPAKVQVLPRTKIQFPNMPPSNPTNPAEFFLMIPTNVPFVFTQSNNNFLIEIVNWGNSNNNQLFTYPLDAASGTTTTRLYASGNPTATNGTLGTGYGHVMCFALSAPVTATFSSFGRACRGSSGLPTIGANGRPVINQNYTVTLSGGRSNFVALSALGLSNTTFGAFTLPLDLTPAGANGCWLLVSLDLVVAAVTDNVGAASLPLKLPNDSALTGKHLYHQWLQIDTVNSFGLVFSDGGDALVGDQ